MYMHASMPIHVCAGHMKCACRTHEFTAARRRGIAVPGVHRRSRVCMSLGCFDEETEMTHACSRLY